MGELREKLKSFAMDNHYKKYGELNAKRLEEISDEYAIEFGAWILRNFNNYGPSDEKELLEIFKKEKDL
jgi:hypothetical protein